MELLSRKRLAPQWVACLLLGLLCATSVLAQHEHGASIPKQGGKARTEFGAGVAFDSRGRLWMITVDGETGKRYVVARYSDDHGDTWTDRAPDNVAPEAIAADGENAPKIVPAKNGALYASWVKKTGEKYTGDVRFSRSFDGGKTWSTPINVHRNRDLISHHLASIIVDDAGRIYVAWIDRRDLHKAERAGRPYAGAAIYYTMSHDGGASFKPERKLVDHVCECCRIALSLDRDSVPVAFWRHVFSGEAADPNGEEVRDHATARLTWGKKPIGIHRATFSGWKISGCPDHGGDLVVTNEGIRHLAWFAIVNNQPTLFYSRLTSNGQRIGAEQSFATGQVSRPTLLINAGAIWLFWKELRDEDTRLMTRWSMDGGATWNEPMTLASSRGATDFPRPIAYKEASFVAWRSEAEGMRVFKLNAIAERK